MRYSGSKQRYIKELIPILTKNLTDDKLYIEPFVGGASIFSQIDHPYKIGYDINGRIIDMWNAFKRGCIPPEHVTEEEYYKMKEDALTNGKTYPSWLLGYVSVACSYGSAPWNGYARFNPKKNEDHIKEAYHGTMKQLSSFKFLDSSLFECKSYDKIKNTYHSVIYCDPPYENCKGYKTGNFDFEKFWDWVRQKKKDGNDIYVSEYNAPSDFTCIWEKEKHDGMGTTLNGAKQNIKIEKLFTLL
jgi:DNA adenine methylase